MDATVSVHLKDGRIIKGEAPTFLDHLTRDDLRPVREPGVHKNQKHIPAYFWMSQLRELVWYESRLEMMCLKQLDFGIPLIGVLPQPFILHYTSDGKRYWHTPDFLVWCTDGSRLLVNVKPTRHLAAPHNQRAFRACLDLAQYLNWSYSTQSEPPPTLRANINWLAGYRRHPPGFELYATTLVERASYSPTIAQLLTEAGPAPFVLPVFFYLLWKRQIEFDHDVLLTSASKVWLT
ncbi:TnsA-like heteromeric transposase endonuclease subunit [Noviherbaspirillum sp. 1P10PC]|uniref:TnsA-like heteromeric transposase endonuclease subunit n=1 Tax=Noviherbaspirillum sp. 1P10PC TaxID=3132292 RepID=UPI0039A2C3FD